MTLIAFGRGRLNNITFKKPIRSLPQYEGDPAIKEKMDDFKEHDGVKPIVSYTFKTDWKVVRKIWKVMTGRR
jgi:hypothetical protein